MQFGYLVGEYPIVQVHSVDEAQRERAKFDELWQTLPEYAADCVGSNVTNFIEIVKPEPPASILDVGCGSGGAGMELAKLGFDVSWSDISSVSINGIDRERFHHMPLWELPLGKSYDYGYCFDVMDSIPIEFTMLAVFKLTMVCKVTYYNICLVPKPTMDQKFGRPVQASVMSFNWWRDRFAYFGKLHEARDLGRNAIYVLENAA
jgi:hypothetical protein